MKDGGIVYMNAPSINIPHLTPYHFYTGPTPVGLGCIVQQAAFEILDIGFWAILNTTITFSTRTIGPTTAT
jgi:hypothetical protein